MLFDFAANMEQKTLFQIKGCRNQVGVLILTAALTSMDLFLTMYVLQDSISGLLVGMQVCTH